MGYSLAMTLPEFPHERQLTYPESSQATTVLILGIVSPEDRAVTTQLVAAGALLGVPVLDHVVVGDARYVSFVEVGLLPQPA